ncbi:MAG: hypothetical protein U0796_15095 [Gemmatales bacterium]
MFPLISDSLPSVPRTIRRDPDAERATRTLLRWLTFLLIAVLAVWGGWMLAEIAIKQRAWTKLLTEGVVTPAEITNFISAAGDRVGQRPQRFAYRYQTESGPLEAENSVWRQNNALHQGETFRVTYLRAEPATHVMGDVTQGEDNLIPASFHYQYEQLVSFLAAAGIFVSLLAVVIAVFVLPVLLSRYRALYQQEYLARNGIAADATIVVCQPDSTVKTLFLVKYQFQPVIGSLVTGSTYIQQSTVEEDRIQAHSSLPVLYDIKHPGDHILLRDLSFVEIVYT